MLIESKIGSVIRVLIMNIAEKDVQWYLEVANVCKIFEVEIGNGENEIEDDFEVG